MSGRMPLAALDMEGVLTPEIWIAVAEATGLPELRRTTRDEPDYGKLMRYRIDILERQGLTLAFIQEVIRRLGPLPGALDFLNRLRATMPVIILSDTFSQFAGPLLVHLGQPVLFCNTLDIDSRGMITGYRLRLEDQKRQAVAAFQGLAFRVVAVGDSFNDTAMLTQADQGIFFRPSQAALAAFPHVPVTTTYDALHAHIRGFVDEAPMQSPAGG